VNKQAMMAFALFSAAACAADDPAQTPPPASAPASASAPVSASAIVAPTLATRPRQAPPISPAASENASPDQTTAEKSAPKFISEARWLLAGYNNNEVVYTVLVTNQDTRIIRCTTQVQGFYVQNGQKTSISDRQITTVFPNDPTQVGNWMDLDEASGATYSVKCHPV
jgi:hypothetical protein